MGIVLTAQEVTEIQKPLLATLDGLTQPLSVLSLVALSEVFYTAAERERLIAEYRNLLDETHRAYAALQQLIKEQPNDECHTYEDREKTWSGMTSNDQATFQSKKLEIKKNNDIAIAEFTRRHPLIRKLFEQAGMGVIERRVGPDNQGTHKRRVTDLTQAMDFAKKFV